MSYLQLAVQVSIKLVENMFRKTSFKGFVILHLIVYSYTFNTNYCSICNENKKSLNAVNGECVEGSSNKYTQSIDNYFVAITFIK